MSRRTSVDNWANKLFSHISKTRNELLDIWSEMALNEEQQQDRLQLSEKTVLELLDDMILSENKQLQNIRSKVATYYNQCNEIRRELGLDDLTDNEMPSGLVPRGNYLKSLLKTLNEEKAQKMEEQIEISKKLRTACERIGDIFNDEIYKKKIMPLSAVAELKLKLVEAERTFKTRLEIIKKIQSDVKHIMTHIGREQFNDKEVEMISTDYDKTSTILDESIVCNFEELFERTSFIYDEWVVKVTNEYASLISDLEDLWKKCHVTEYDKKFPLQFNPELQTQNDVEKLKAEIVRLTTKYKEAQDIYDKYNEWFELWQEHLTFENPGLGAEKYKNRGGSLQAYLKREKVVKSLIYKVLSELETLCFEYSKEHENMPTIESVFINEYARQLIEIHEADKQLAKVNKEKEKKGRLNHESRFGVSPSPSKSTLHRTRITPGSIQKKSKRNISQLSISTIEPTMTPGEGPKTSSPVDDKGTPKRKLQITSPNFSPMVLRSHLTPSKVAVIHPNQRKTTTPSKPWRY